MTFSESSNCWWAGLSRGRCTKSLLSMAENKRITKFTFLNQFSHDLYLSQDWKTYTRKRTNTKAESESETTCGQEITSNLAGCWRTSGEARSRFEEWTEYILSHICLCMWIFLKTGKTKGSNSAWNPISVFSQHSPSCEREDTTEALTPRTSECDRIWGQGPWKR